MNTTYSFFLFLPSSFSFFLFYFPSLFLFRFFCLSIYLGCWRAYVVRRYAIALSAPFTLHHHPYTTGGVDHTLLGRFFKLDCSTSKEGANTERFVFGMCWARRFQRRPFWHRHYYFNCGDVGPGSRARCGVGVV